MKEDIRSTKDWLEEFHEGQRLQRQAMEEIKSIARHLRYTFPHVADDLMERYSELQESEKLISSGLNRSMDEQLKSSQEFIGSALSGILNAYEKETK